MTRTRIAVVAAGAVATALLVAGLAGARTSTPARAHQNLAVSGSISFDGIWTSSSGQKQFQDVINGFEKIYPKVKVNYKPVGNNLPTVLATAVAGGHPPDMADIAQPGTIAQFAKEGKLKPITYAKSTMSKYFAPAWTQLGTFSGKLYALPFKAANKSVVWYNVPAFKAAGVTPPKTFAQLRPAAKVIKSSATPAYSIGGADYFGGTRKVITNFGGVQVVQYTFNLANTVQRFIKKLDPNNGFRLAGYSPLYMDVNRVKVGGSGLSQYNIKLRIIYTKP